MKKINALFIERKVPQGMVLVARTIKEGPLSFVGATSITGYTQEELNCVGGYTKGFVV